MNEKTTRDDKQDDMTKRQDTNAQERDGGTRRPKQDARRDETHGHEEHKRTDRPEDTRTPRRRREPERINAIET